MSASNSHHLIGNLTRDAELKYTNGGTPVIGFDIAVNYRKRQGDNWVDDADFFSVAMFGKRAESLAQYLTKGQPVAVEGETHIEKWEKDGQPHMRVKVTANDIRLLNRREGGGEGRGGNGGGSNYSGSSHDWARDRGAGQPGDRRGGAPSGGGRAPERHPADDFTDDVPF